MPFQTCRRHPSAQFALSCPGCKQEIHDKQYPDYASTAAVVHPVPTTVDPAVAYQLTVIDECRPAIAALRAKLDRRANWADDISVSLLWQLERAKTALHIAEERLLDLHGMSARSTTARPLPVRQPGTNLAPDLDPASAPRPAFTFSWADPDTRPAAWRAFGEPVEQGEQ
jgi:hypothetical protein